MPRREWSCHEKLSARLARSELTCLGSASMEVYGRKGWASLESPSGPHT